MSYTPIDVWAETEHPQLLANVRAHIDILCASMNEDDRYSIVRGIMQYVRQEFEDN